MTMPSRSTRASGRPVAPPALSALAALCLAVLLPQGIAGLEIGGSFRLGTLGFALDRAQTDATFSGDKLQWGASLSVQQPLSDDFSFASAFERDLILRNTVYNTLTFRQSFLRIGVGPFFGVFNSTVSILKPGLTTSVQVEFPGVAYLYFRSDSTIGGRLVEVGDYTQERSDVAAGIYVGSVILSANLRSRRFSQKTSAAVETVDGLTAYALETDIFRKNAPYKILLSFGYHQLTRTFVDAALAEPVRHALNSIVLGTNVDMYITGFLTTSLNLESSIYTFGGGSLLGISNPGPGGYLFRVSVGFSLNTDRIPVSQ